MRIGVISDTHGHLPAMVHKVFAGVDHILHAGDVGPMEVVWELERLAPVSAVRGNTDHGIDLPETRIDEFAGKKFLLHHIVSFPCPMGAIASCIAEEKLDVVVFGHTHMPCNKSRDGILWLNPGSATQPRGGHPASVALVDLHDDLKAHIKPLAAP